jgi:teichuronic acid biosynthesis glycosyltransferase TuaC
MLFQTSGRKHLNVLLLSDLFPNPARPAYGVFVERQVFHQQPYCKQTVVAPVRVFPRSRLWTCWGKPAQCIARWREWWQNLQAIPERAQVKGVEVFYPRYTSPPRQITRALWGHFAYLFIARLLQNLHRIHSFDLIHAHNASPSGGIALLAQRWMKVPVVLTVHGSDVHYIARQNRFSAQVIEWVFCNVDAILTNSRWTLDQIAHYGGDPEKVQIVRLGGDMPGGVEIEYDESQDNGPLTLLSVGSLRELKGHAYVLRAVRKLIDQGYNLRYVIVGNGKLRESLERLTDVLGLRESVTFEGHKAHHKVWSYYAACDIFVLPSYPEAFGIVYIEALRMGKPVVGCVGAGGPEDLHTLGDCIELVNPRDVESLVVALRHLLDNPERRQQMGKLGQRIVANHFTWQRTARETLAVYERVLNI